MTPATMLNYDGIEQPISEWALDYGLMPAVIIARLERGLSPEAAITTPMVTAKGQKLTGDHLAAYIKSLTASPATRYEFDGMSLSLTEWAHRTGISRQVLSRRAKDGWSIERMLTEPTGAHRRPRTITATDEATA